MNNAASWAPWVTVAIAAIGQVVTIALTRAQVRDLREWRKDEVDPFMREFTEWKGRVREQLHQRRDHDADESRY